MKRLHLWLCVAAAATLYACDRNVTYTQDVSQPATCFNCHSDQDTRLVAAQQEYAFSVHASGAHVSETSSGCNGCHTSEGFIQRIEAGTTPQSIDHPTAIHCFTCHEPHTSGTLKLRVETPVALANGVKFDLHQGNLCTECHQARRDVGAYVVGRVKLSNRWGPHHGVQGDMLEGTNGYEYPSFTYEQTTHKTATDNGCVDCHMKVSEGLTLGGHSWNMAYDDGTGEVQNVGACTAKCHATATDFDYNGQQTATLALADQLRTLLVTGGLLDDTTGLPTSVTTSADSAGAVWNYLMATEDRSEGVHNRKYIQGLLQSAIDFLQGAPFPAAANNAVARREDGRAGSR